MRCVTTTGSACSSSAEVDPFSGHCRAPAMPAAAVTDVIDVGDATAWYQGVLGELHALLAGREITPGGPGHLFRAPATTRSGRLGA